MESRFTAHITGYHGKGKKNCRDFFKFKNQVHIRGVPLVFPAVG